VGAVTLIRRYKQPWSILFYVPCLAAIREHGGGKLLFEKELGQNVERPKQTTSKYTHKNPPTTGYLPKQQTKQRGLGFEWLIARRCAITFISKACKL
jgi:hypothetical protein